MKLDVSKRYDINLNTSKRCDINLNASKQLQGFSATIELLRDKFLQLKKSLSIQRPKNYTSTRAKSVAQ